MPILDRCPAEIKSGIPFITFASVILGPDEEDTGIVVRSHLGVHGVFETWLELPSQGRIPTHEILRQSRSQAVPHLSQATSNPRRYHQRGLRDEQRPVHRRYNLAKG